jgi:hypothetical protein
MDTSHEIFVRSSAYRTDRQTSSFMAPLNVLVSTLIIIHAQYVISVYLTFLRYLHKKLLRFASLS